ncbi:MAG: glycerol-3-phosphate dehydrogenase/oxidase, partial [Cyclobacteriaceae bacterium]|nr:glycerol-3-phosphate dehydrogenase/oxidase [Cyclobacteriaceae bacterium]
MNCFNTLDRPLLVQKINQSVYDLLIIGGGITGAGIALDAASRGFRTLLIEKNDFASGTSSKSTKLIHGGLRYLKQFEIALVREVGLERAIIHRLAPHLVKSEKMLLPLIKDGTYGKILTSVGLMVYDVLAGVEKADQRKMLTKEETLEEEMLIDESILEGGGIYAEYRTDDARLTIEVLKTAASYGADIINYAEALDFNYEAGTIAGIRWRDNLNRAENNTKGTYTVSATGPWVDELRAKNKSLTGKRLHPTKGVHIVVPHERFPVRHAIYFDVPDGRMIFAIPRGRATYVGTTDTDYFGDLNDVRVTREDVQYLVEGVNHIFPKVNLSVEEVESTWVGLRPLIGEEGKEASDLSRKDEIFESDTGLLSIAGGKLTGYRKMAERIVNLIVEKEKAEKPCMTEWISLNGGLFKGSVEVDTYTRQVERKLQNEGLAHLAAYLVGNYGRQTDLILEHFNALDGHIPDVRLGLAELEFCVHNEAVFSALDFLEHRTGRLFFDIHSISFLKEPVLDFLTNFFNWTDE